MKTILILGAGFAGLRCARELERRISDPHTKIVLVDKNDFHFYTPLLYEVATAAIRGEAPAGEHEVREGVSVPLHVVELMAGRKIDFFQATVQTIDASARLVTFDHGLSIPYDFLVIALGSVTDYFAVPGLKEHAYHVKTVYDALAIRRRIFDIVESAREQKCPCHVIFGGGGATGCEFASELANFFARLRTDGALPKNGISITVIEASDRLLGAADQKFSTWAAARLKTLGVEVQTGKRITRVEHKKIFVQSFKSGRVREEEFDSDVLVWTGGVCANPLLASSGFSVDKKGRVEVDGSLRVKGHERIFALGDAAAFFDSLGKVLPMMADVAVAEAPTVADNVARACEGRELRTFIPRTPSMVIPLGGKYGIAQFGTATYAGFFGWVTRKFVDLKYFLSVMPPSRAFSTWWSGFTVYGRND